jgi:fatty acyl-CoA reductase
MQKRIHGGLEVFQYYTTRPWYFCNDNFTKLWNEMTKRDREIFYTNRNKIDYNQYLLDYVLGARRYCVREDPETLPYARKTVEEVVLLRHTQKYSFGFVCLVDVFILCDHVFE